MESIRRQDFKNDLRNQVQELVANAVEKNPNQFIEHFKKLPLSFGGRFISSDTFKETFESYSASNESRNLFNSPVHNAAAVLASEQFRRILQTPPKTANDSVILLTGIPGAGKTSSVLRKGSLREDTHAVYEGQLANPQTAIQKIQQVLDAGHKPKIVVVHAKPENALDNALLRFNEIGRGASLEVIAKIQAGLPESLAAVHQKFGNMVELIIIDRRENKQKRIEGWENLATLESEGNYEQIRTKLEQHLENRRDSISPDAYRQAAGIPPIVREGGFRGRHDGGLGRNDAGQRTAEENRNDVGVVGQRVVEKTPLSVPYSEREAAKAAGAKWDTNTKSWYAPAGADLLKLAAWTVKHEPVFVPHQATPNRIRSALNHLDANGRDTWLRMGTAIKSELGDSGFDIWDEWSQTGDSYNPRDARAVWRSMRLGKVSIGSLFFEAKQNGWKDSEKYTPTASELAELAERQRVRQEQAAQEQANELKKHERTADRVHLRWNRLPDSKIDHPYLKRKGVAAHGVKIEGDKLVIPARDINGKLWSLQTIPADPQAKKLFEKDGKKRGNMHILGNLNAGYQGTVLIAEGYATAASIFEALGEKVPVVVAFDSGNLDLVVGAVKQHYPSNTMYIMGDDDRHLDVNVGVEKAHAAAAKYNIGVGFPIFNGTANGLSDFNDLDKTEGRSVLQAQISKVLSLSMEKSRYEAKKNTLSAHPTKRGTSFIGDRNAVKMIESVVSGERIDVSMTGHKKIHERDALLNIAASTMQTSPGELAFSFDGVSGGRFHIDGMELKDVLPLYEAAAQAAAVATVKSQLTRWTNGETIHHSNLGVLVPNQTKHLLGQNVSPQLAKEIGHQIESGELAKAAGAIGREYGMQVLKAKGLDPTAPTVAEQAERLKVRVVAPNKQNNNFHGLVIGDDYRDVLIQISKDVAIYVPKSEFFKQNQKMPRINDNVILRYASGQLVEINQHLSPQAQIKTGMGR